MTCISSLLAVLVSAVPDDSVSLVVSDTVFSPVQARDEEILFEQNESEQEQLQLMDRVQWLRENPLDLNTATGNELALIPGITAHEAQTIIGLRNRVGKFVSVDQLSVIDDLGPTVVAKLVSYVVVERPERPAIATRRPVLQVRSRVVRDLQPRGGFLDGSFVGSSVKTYSRIGLNVSKDIQAGVLLAKDAGEQFTTGFISGFIGTRIGTTHVLLGDFTMQGAQGLVFGGGGSYGKGSDAVHSVVLSGSGLRPYRSSDEFNFFRGVGVAASVNVPPGVLRFSVLASRRQLGATVNDDGTFSAFYDAGYFRTENEIKKKNSVRESVIGGRLELVGQSHWLTGVSYYHSEFDRTKISESPFVFSGKVNDIAGADVSVRIGRMNGFAEVARSGQGGTAALAGSVITLSRSTQLAFVYRNYGATFDHLHAGGFGERSTTSNEYGFYVGIQSAVTRQLRFTGYIDHFRFPKPGATVPLPAAGNDLFCEVDMQVVPSLSLTGRYSQKNIHTSETITDELGRDMRAVVERSQHRARMTATYHITPAVRVRGRIEGTRVEYPLLHGHELGHLFFQEVRFRATERIVLEVRIVFFDTESFDSRLYEYENDIRGVFSNPALYGSGRRWYLLARYGLSDEIGVSMKYSETQKDGVLTMGSGSLEVAGDTDNRLSLQLDIQW